MKKYVLPIVLIILLFCLTSCSSKLSPKSVLKEFKRRHPDIECDAIRYQESQDAKNFDDIVYQISAKEGQTGQDFNIYYLMSYSGGFGQSYRIDSDYDSQMARYHYDQYQGAKKGFTLEKPSLETLGQAMISIDYSDLASLKLGLANLKAYAIYAGASNPELVFNIKSMYVNPGDYFFPQGSPGSDAESLLKLDSNLIENFDQVEQAALKAYVKYCLVHQENLSEIEPLKDLITEADNKGTYLFIVESNGQSYTWDDLILDGFRMSQPTLYQILSRIKYPSLSGNQDDFSFTGIDGQVYQFSKDFKDNQRVSKLYDKNKAYYFLKGQEKIYFNDYGGMLNTANRLEEILGIDIQLRQEE